MTYFIIAGEASGDLHAARLIKAIKQITPEATFIGMGGDLMEAEGCTLIQHYKNMAFMGIVNVVMNLGKINENINLCRRKIIEIKPDAIILTDYPGFNLRIARWVKKSLPHIPIHYYIAPKLWAWKSWRIKTIKRYVDHMYTIFPFETEYFKNKGYDVTYVGNPCADAINDWKDSALPLDQFKAKHKLDHRPIIALLAGSRKQEIKGCLKIMSKMQSIYPDYQFVISGAPGIDSSYYHTVCDTQLPIITADTYNLIYNSHAAVVNSGTATLETALIGTPQVVVYHVFGGILASFVRKLLLHIPHVSLVNLIAEKEAVCELIAHQFTEKNLQRELEQIVNNPTTRNRIIGEYIIIKSKLGEYNTSQQCATEITNNLS